MRERRRRSGSSFFFFFRPFKILSSQFAKKTKDALDPVGPHLDAADPPGEHVEEHGDLERGDKGEERERSEERDEGEMKKAKETTTATTAAAACSLNRRQHFLRQLSLTCVLMNSVVNQSSGT